METQRIKVKVGENEFDAEGPVEIVQRQFDAWKALIEAASKLTNVITSPHENQAKTNNNAGLTEESKQLEKIFKVEGRVVSLTVKPDSEGTAAMLVMLGHRNYRNTEAVTASELRSGLEHSGYRFSRVDRLMEPLCDEGLAIQIGARKGTRYRLTNPGIVRAHAAAKEAISQVA